MIDALIYGRFLKIICVSRQVQKSLVEWVPQVKLKTEIIPNGIPIHSKSDSHQLIKKY